MSIKKTPSPVFNSGDYVVYPTHGVGKVSDISKQNIAGTQLQQQGFLQRSASVIQRQQYIKRSRRISANL